MTDQFWEDDSAYDATAETLKRTLKDSVSQEISDRIAALTAKNAELTAKLKNLDTLTLEAQQARIKYEREYANARSDAQRDARKLKLAELIGALDERLYTLERKYVLLEKCNRCNDNRQLVYLTPRGRTAVESCECAGKDVRWVAVETAAHEVSRRDGKLLLWWVPVTRYTDSDDLNAKHLQRSAGIDLEQIAKRPSEYSFPDLATAQQTADAINTAADSQREASR